MIDPTNQYVDPLIRETLAACITDEERRNVHLLDCMGSLLTAMQVPHFAVGGGLGEVDVELEDPIPTARFSATPDGWDLTWLHLDGPQLRPELILSSAALPECLAVLANMTRR